MKILVYTFRTFPRLKELEGIFGEVVVLGKLKEDLGKMFELIEREKPEMILGVALSNGDDSVFEGKTINQFHKRGKVLKDGKDGLELFVPDLRGTDFKISTRITDSFCNFSMFRVQNWLEENGLEIPFAFCHVKKEEVERLDFVIK